MRRRQTGTEGSPRRRSTSTGTFDFLTDKVNWNTPQKKFIAGGVLLLLTAMYAILSSSINEGGTRTTLYVTTILLYLVSAGVAIAGGILDRGFWRDKADDFAVIIASFGFASMTASWGYTVVQLEFIPYIGVFYSAVAKLLVGVVSLIWAFVLLYFRNIKVLVLSIVYALILLIAANVRQGINSGVENTVDGGIEFVTGETGEEAKKKFQEGWEDTKETAGAVKDAAGEVLEGTGELIGSAADAVKKGAESVEKSFEELNDVLNEPSETELRKEKAKQLRGSRD